MSVRIPDQPTEVTTLGQTYQLTGNPARDLVASPNVRIILFLALHVPLAFVAESFPVVSTVHGLLALVVALWAAVTRRAGHVIFMLAYIASAETLWRMSRASLLWEYSKYAMVIIVAVALLFEWWTGKSRGDRSQQRVRSLLPLFLLVTLLPGAIIPVLQEGLGGARDALSFNLSGYLALVAVALYVWARRLSYRQTIAMLLGLLAPAISVASLAISNTAAYSDAFVAASNWVTSGNYGPNQVSNVLGLGALAGVILVVMLRNSTGIRLLLLLVTFALLGQAMLTFSRGGVYSFFISFVAFGFHLMSSPRARGRFLVLAAVGLALLLAVVFPSLNNLTSGALAQRFADLDTTGRLEAAQADWQAFLDNPVTGVGVGLGDQYREEVLGVPLAAHTAYTRLLGEHGLFGIMTMLIMLIMFVVRYRGNEVGLPRAIMSALGLIALTFMIHSAMRMAIISFAFAIAMAAFPAEPVREAVTQTGRRAVIAARQATSRARR